MDPISIATIVVQTTASCLKTTKSLYDLNEKFKDAPMAAVSICSESSVISASLAQIQGLLLQRHDLADVWKSRTELPVVLDNALTGCMVVFSCLDAEIQRIVAGASDPSKIRWRSRARLLWNETKLNELLSSLRGQQTAINLLISLLQMDTLNEIKHMLWQRQDTVRTSANITQSLRSNNPSIRVTNSIYGGNDDNHPGSTIMAFEHDAVSMTAPSELEFDFDDMIINSQAYRRAFAQAHTHALVGATHQEDIGDLIDLTDNLTFKQEVTSASDEPLPHAFQDLQDLVFHETPARSQTKDSVGHDVKVAETNQVETTALMVAEPEDMDVTQSQSRSTTPTLLIRRDEPPTNPPPQRPKAATKICHKCSKVITGQFVRPQGMNNQMFHLDCFRCADCSIVIAAKYFPLEDAPSVRLCETDYFRRLNLLCFSCGGALKGSYITGLDRKFHIEHFTCEAPGCDTIFGEKDSYYETEGGDIFCGFHYAAVARLCFGCCIPIFSHFVEKEENQVNAHWHPDCYMIHKFWACKMSKIGARIKFTDGEWMMTTRVSTDGSGSSIIDKDALLPLFSVVENEIYQVWSILSEFEEGIVASFSDAMRHLMEGDGDEFEAASKMILRRATVLFKAIRLVVPHPQGNKEAKLLCKKTVRLFSLASEKFRAPPKTPTTTENKMTQEIKTLVSGLAHYTKWLIKIGLSTSVESKATDPQDGSLVLFLDALSTWETTTDSSDSLIRRVNEISLYSATSDLCQACNNYIESRCYSSGPAGGSISWHEACMRCQACGKVGGYDFGDMEERVVLEMSSINCKFCRLPAAGPIFFIPQLSQYSFLLHVALARLLKFMEH
ncbi:hypothetical protein B0H63DRAFT_509510 [Podospora didyma]|uniref:LIM zinc-binding domain-containing protein n=1 Tax=Podospora didyma TaxID=330526 RepID=A0AAE0U1Q2_9PEZI|nr:hypothetical protein B0H63DRAFT_509510 [Podospora didyma]